MSNEAINIIENVKKKLEKYSELKQDDKVQEYLTKLQHVGVTIDLLKRTKVDYVVKKLCSQNNRVYSETAKDLLKKWISEPNKNGHSMNGKLNTNKSTKKRKSNEDFSNEANEPHLSDDCSTANKKRKVLSMNEYFSKRSSNVLIASLDSDSQNNEKLTTELMNGNQSNNTNLTETEIEELRDSFNKTTNLLAANAPKLDNIRDDNNNEKKQSLSSIKGFTKSNLESQQNGNSDKKLKGLWEEASDDDEEETVVKQKQTTVSKINNDGNDPVQRKKKQSLPTSSVSSKTKTTIQPKKGSIVTKTKLSPKKSIQSSTKNVPEKSQEQTKSLSTSDKQSEHLKHQQTISTTVRTSLPPPPRPSQLTASSSQSTLKKSSVIDNTSLQCLSSRRERTQMYSGKKTIRDHIPKLESLCLDTLKEHIDVISSRHFNLLPYELLQPIIELATPEQLKNIVYNNQNYADDIEPLWKRFCQIDFKSSEPDENESYFELYWRKHDEKEDLFQEVKSKLAQKFAHQDDTARKTKMADPKKLSNEYARKIRHHQSVTNGGGSQSQAINNIRMCIAAPSNMRNERMTTKRKPAKTPLLKKTLKLYNRN